MGIDSNTLISLKRTIKNFVDISDEKIDSIAELFAKKTYKRNEHFSTIENPSTYLGYIAKGLVRVYVIDRKGNEATLNFRGENIFTSAYSGIVLNKVQPLYIQTLEDSEIYVIERDKFVNIWETDSDWKNLLNVINEFDGMRLREREIGFLQDDAKTRYLTFLKNFGNIADRIKLRYISSYLGISAETLSRIRSTPL